jgi:hypothetical protein
MNQKFIKQTELKNLKNEEHQMRRLALIKKFKQERL